jgi:sucrose-6-phosphate hydrolase SacC (GH32 family)
MDEEWPAGKRLFEFGDEISSTINIRAEEYNDSQANEPSVISVFENADGWYPGNGVFVGDCMPYRRGDEYHVLYLKDRHHHGSKWGLGAHQWEHISTTDFKKWQIHPMAIPITDSTEGSICTGSWIKNGDKEYLYYTVRMGRGIPAPIRRSVSNDGYHFEKDREFGFTVSDKYQKTSARDPKVVKGEDGLFHMFLTTSLIEEGKGCLAHYVSRDMEKWEDFGEPIYIAPSTDQPECPDYFKYNGRYYLIFSLKGRAHYMVSDKPFENFVMPDEPIIPCSSVPKCAEWNGRLIFTGFKVIGGYGGTMTFKAATSKENGELMFEEL